MTCRIVPRWFALVSATALAVSAAGSARGEDDVVLTTSAGLGGIGVYVPNRWGVVMIGAVNNSSEPQEISTASFFEGDPHTQYGRKLRIPPQSRLRSWYRVLSPEPRTPEQRYDLQTLLYRNVGGRETLARSDVGMMQFDNVVPRDDSKVITVKITDPEFFSNSDTTGLYEVMVAGRTSQGHTRQVRTIADPELMPSPESLDGADQIILAGNAIRHHAAAIQSLRHWLHRGGQLWIPLTIVEPETVQMLVGDEMPFSVVNRVQLTDVAIVDEKITASVRSKPATREFEVPVPFVRVIGEGIEPIYSVDGWPAAFWQNYGEGRILYTTLGSWAWIRPRGPRDRPPPSVSDMTGHFPTEEFLTIASEYFLPRPERAVPPERFQAYIEDQVGYRVPGRLTVAAMLGAFCASVIAVGLVLARQRRLEHLAWIASALSLGTLSVWSAVSRPAIENSVARGQWNVYHAGSRTIHTTALTGLYHPAEQRVTFQGRSGSVARLDMRGLEGTTRRLLTEDLESWAWENVALPQGLRLAAVEGTTSVATPIEVRLQFAEDGLRGTWNGGPLAQVEDPVLLAFKGRYGVTLGAGGSCRVPLSSRLDGRQFVPGTILSDEQRRRQAILQATFDGERGRSLLARPLMAVWSAPLPDGILTGEDALAEMGSALTIVPVTWEPASAGTRVRIPSAWMRYRAVPDPDGAPISPLFNNRTLEFASRSGATHCWLRFWLPDVVLPMKVDELEVSLNVSGPANRIELFGWDGREMISLVIWDNPIGRMEGRIRDPRVLKPDEDGSVRLGIYVGDPARQLPESGGPREGRAEWQIEDFRAELTGVVEE